MLSQHQIDDLAKRHLAALPAAVAPGVEVDLIEYFDEQAMRAAKPEETMSWRDHKRLLKRVEILVKIAGGDVKRHVFRLHDYRVWLQKNGYRPSQGSVMKFLIGDGRKDGRPYRLALDVKGDALGWAILDLKQILPPAGVVKL